MRIKVKFTAEQKLDDALFDAETFIDSAMGEISESLTYLRNAKQGVRAMRMRIARARRRLQQPR